MEIVVPETKATDFKQIFDTIREVPIEETNLDINSEGISLQTMDSTHVSVVSLVIDKTYFEKYICQKPLALGVNLVILTKLLKSVSKQDTITLATESNSEYLVLSLKNKVRQQTFHIPLFDLNLENLKIPSQNYALIYSVNSQEFSRILNDVSLVEGKEITLKMGMAQITISSKGDLGKTDITMSGVKIEPDKISSIKIEPNCWLIKDTDEDKIQANFNLDFLKNISKAKQFTRNNVLISFQKDFPLAINYQFDTGCHLILHLAPKLEDDSIN